MTVGLDVTKAGAPEIVHAMYDGVVNGDIEVLADGPSRKGDGVLSGSIDRVADGLFDDGVDRLSSL
jgi:hypothetical protein